MKQTSSGEFDQIDQKILDVLAKEGRIPVTALAARIGLSATPTQLRMKRLEEEGFIHGYRAVLDAARLELNHVAFVEVKLTDTKEEALLAFNAAVRQQPEIEECHMIAGAFDYLLKIRTRHITAYRKFLGETLSKLPLVGQTSTHVVMEAVKDRGP